MYVINTQTIYIARGPEAEIDCNKLINVDNIRNVFYLISIYRLIRFNSFVLIKTETENREKKNQKIKKKRNLN